MKRSNITTLSLPWNHTGSNLPKLAQFIRLSLQKLRLEYKNKEAMPAIWRELGQKIGRRGCLQVDGIFEMGCGANPSTRIDAAKHPSEAAQLKALYAAPAAMAQEAKIKGWVEEQIVPNLSLSVTGIPSPIEPTQDEVKAMIELVPDTKQRCQISATSIRAEIPACFRFSHRRRQEKAIERKLDFIRDQALAELRDYRKGMGKSEDHAISIQTQVDAQTAVTASFFSQDQHNPPRRPKSRKPSAINVSKCTRTCCAVRAFPTSWFNTPGLRSKASPKRRMRCSKRAPNEKRRRVRAGIGPGPASGCSKRMRGFIASGFPRLSPECLKILLAWQSSKSVLPGRAPRLGRDPAKATNGTSQPFGHCINPIIEAKGYSSDAPR